MQFKQDQIYIAGHNELGHMVRAAYIDKAEIDGKEYYRFRRLDGLGIWCVPIEKAETVYLAVF